MIEENELNNQIEEARQKLRDGRREQASTYTVPNSSSSNGETRSSVQLVASRDGQSVQGNRGNAGDHAGERDSERSTETESKRIRPRRRRLGSVDPSTADTQQETRATNRATDFGGIERIDGEFFRPEEKKEEPKKPVEGLVTKLINKLPDSSEDIPFLGGKGKGKLFTKTEAKEFYEPLKQAISDYGDYLDIYMDKIEQGHPATWGNLTDKELDIATRALLKMAQTNPRAASFTRLMIDGQDYIGLLVILLPRVSVTLQFVGRRIPRKSRQRRENHS